MEMGELLGWVQTLLQELGVWDTLMAVINVSLLIVAASALLKFLRGA